MKKILNSIIFVILLIVYTNATAQQSIEISFAANYYEQPVNIDSILIKNINRNCDTMLYAPDTTLMLYYTVGLNENQNINNNFSVSQNYPNSAINNSTSINVIVPKNELLKLRLFDIMARCTAPVHGHHTANRIRYRSYNSYSPYSSSSNSSISRDNSSRQTGTKTHWYSAASTILYTPTEIQTLIPVLENIEERSDLQDL